MFLLSAVSQGVILLAEGTVTGVAAVHEMLEGALKCLSVQSWEELQPYPSLSCDKHCLKD